jgi:CubicO group peptidase (beta-lactamase class C family)
MTTPRKKLTRRAALAGLAGIGGLSTTLPLGDGLSVGSAQAQQPFRAPEEAIPITGKAGPGLEPFDPAMLAIMDHHGVPGAALAIAKNGKLVLAKGYGWANAGSGEAVRPDTLFGLASLSKPFTAIATLKLVEQGKLGLDDSIFDILKHIRPPRGARVDPRLRNVTVRHCLNHSGGWDRQVTGDCINWEPQICRAYRIRPPLSVHQLISFTFGMPLNFNPGTEAKYSNIGYILLGEVIAKISDRPYDRFVVEHVLKPMEITRAKLHARNGKYLAGEALRHLPGTLIPLPAMKLPMLDAAGGWSCTVVDMVRFLTNLDGSRGTPVLSEKTRKLMLEPPPEPLKPRDNGTYFGLGWDAVRVKDKAFTYFKDGSYQGMRTFMKRLPTGVNWALLYNASMEFDPQDMQLAAGTIHEVRQLIERFDKYPDIDLFKEYP